MTASGNGGRGRASGREAGGGDATTRSSDPVEAAPGLPEPMARVLADYERHLVSERDLTPHTVRAYAGDIAAMLEHAARLGHHDVATIDLRALRSWLASQQTRGRARTTVARRATAVRVFTAWAHRAGHAPADAGSGLGSPRAHRTLPPAGSRRQHRGRRQYYHLPPDRHRCNWSAESDRWP